MGRGEGATTATETAVIISCFAILIVCCKRLQTRTYVGAQQAAGQGSPCNESKESRPHPKCSLAHSDVYFNVSKDDL